jgi:hypothetical protein
MRCRDISPSVGQYSPRVMNWGAEGSRKVVTRLVVPQLAVCRSCRRLRGNVLRWGRTGLGGLLGEGKCWVVVHCSAVGRVDGRYSYGGSAVVCGGLGFEFLSVEYDSVCNSMFRCVRTRDGHRYRGCG